MTSREKIRKSLGHESGPVPMDFGATAVSGMHCSCVAGLRDHYGLEERPVKIHEPYQMLGLMEGDLLDTQHVLPFGTPEEVRAQVLERCEIFSQNGGFVFNAIHNVQAQTPTENIVAMIEAVREFNSGTGLNSL